MNSSNALVARREIDAIELTIFADLLTRVSRFHPLSGFAYGGMSGFAVDDLRKLYRTLGLRQMLSFDDRQAVVARQRFNRPSVENRVCIATIDEFAAEWQRIFVEQGIEDAENFILWIRRDTSSEIGHGVRYFQQMVGGLGEHGIARITLRISYEDWAGPEFVDGTRRTTAEREIAVSHKISDHLSEFLEVNDLAERLDEDGLCRCLATAYGNAAGTAVGGSTGRTFEPLSVIRYGQGPIELTLTGMIVKTMERGRIRGHIEEGGWPFSSRSWSDVQTLRLPDLTLRERLALEAAAGDKFVANEKLKFDLDEATGENGVFDSFARYHRYLPTLVAAEI